RSSKTEIFLPAEIKTVRNARANVRQGQAFAVAQGDQPFEQAEEAIEPANPFQPTTRPAPARSGSSTSSENQPEKKDKIDPKSLEGLKKRFHEAQTRIAKQKNLPAPNPPDDKKLIVVLENPHLSQGQYRSNNNYDRGFVVHMQFANPTKEDLQIKRSDLILHSDKKTYKAVERLSRYHDSYRIDGNYTHLSNLKTPDVIKVPAGKTASAWAVFSDMPTNPAIPDLELAMIIEGTKPDSKETRKIDVNEFSGALLEIQVERLGPKNCLAVITLGGQLDPINVNDLVDELDNLAVTQKVARVILRWEKDAATVESILMNWLQNEVNQAGQIRQTNTNNYNPYPIIPMSIREFHLAERPKDNGGSSSSGTRIHKSVDEAIIAALRTAYLALSGNEIVDDLRHKNPTIRAAALVGGGGRLPPEKLSV
ncbi:MAG: hypothetical protein KDA84_05430, partial [Planctomycetaceae bacterium]|nr:hypothetical protein [Planctomycetaceae bacterium]